MREIEQKYASPDFPATHDLNGTYAGPAVAAQEAERDSAAVRLFLVQHGLGDLANALEIRFERVAFFAAQMENPPHGVLAPLIWLSHHTGAFSDLPGWYWALGNLRRWWRRALRGREGPRAANIAWGLIIIGGPLAVLLIGLLFGWKVLALAVAGGIAAVIWRFFWK